MAGIWAMIKNEYRRRTAGTLLAVMLAMEVLPVLPPIFTYAAVSPSGNHGPYAGSGEGDLWEKLESRGEVVIAFPSQVEAAISSPEDIDSYSFRLQEETDVLLTLESEYPCGLEVSANGSVLGTSNKPYSQTLVLSGLSEGTYTARITPENGVKSSSYILRISRQTNGERMPDFSEAHIAGATYDPESPFRFLNIQNPEQKNRGNSPLAVIHYLAHWQGPVNESVVPYYDKGDFGETPSDWIYYKKSEPEFHIQNALLLPGRSRDNDDGEHIEHWKNAIMTYGTVQTGFTVSMNYRDRNEESGDADYDFRYLYTPLNGWDGEKYGGHATLIVGWDDTIDREKFRITSRDMDGTVIAEAMPERDGAWICRDSYGTELESYPDYYYVSYESADFGTASYVPVAYGFAERSDNYNHLYSNSAGGMTDVGSEAEGFLRASETFQNEGEGELLRAVGVAAKQEELTYEIGVRIGDGPIEKVKSGYLKYPGFYTVRLEEGIMIPGATDFEIHVALSSDDNQKGIGFYTCRNIAGWINGVREIPGKAFYYTSWDEEEEAFDASEKGEYPCIYAYTYSPLKSEITILDNKEAFEGYETATNSELSEEPDIATKSDLSADSDTDTKPEWSARPDAATKSDLSKAPDNGMEPEQSAGPDAATKSDLSKAPDNGTNPEQSVKPGTAAKSYWSVSGLKGAVHLIRAATASDAEHEEAPEENEAEAAGKDEEERNNEFEFRLMRNREPGVIPLDGTSEMEVTPLNLNLPKKYNSRDSHLITKAKNQGTSNICWAFAGAGALEAAYLKFENQMINYPRGLNLVSQEQDIEDGVISIKMKAGQKVPLNLAADLYSDSAYFNPGSPQIYWEISGDLSSVESGSRLSESGADHLVLTAAAPGNVTVTAVSMADTSLRTSCQVSIGLAVPAKVRIRPETMTLNIGETRQLETEVEADEELTVIYVSDRPDIVTVDKEGRVLALKKGQATVTAKAGEGEAACQITVRGGNGGRDRGTANTSAYSSEKDTVTGTWEQDAAGWRLKKEDGSYVQSAWEKIGGRWYYFKEDSYIATGWLQQGDTWYYLNQGTDITGKMETGWIYDPVYEGWFYLEENGVMATGWRQISGVWYYFHEISDGQKGKCVLENGSPPIIRDENSIK